MRRDLTALPKAHLHLHLTGSMRPDTLRELAARYGVELPPELLESTRRTCGRRSGVTGRSSSASTTRRGRPFGPRPTSDRVIREAAAADVADGVVWLEIQVNPVSYAARFGAAPGPDRAAAGRRVPRGPRTRPGSRWAGHRDQCGATPRTAWPRTLARVAASFAGRGVVGFGICPRTTVGVGPADFAGCVRHRPAGRRWSPRRTAATTPVRTTSGPACDEAGRAADRPRPVAVARDATLLDRLARERVTLELCPTLIPAAGRRADAGRRAAAPAVRRRGTGRTRRRRSAAVRRRPARPVPHRPRRARVRRRRAGRVGAPVGAGQHGGARPTRRGGCRRSTAGCPRTRTAARFAGRGDVGACRGDPGSTGPQPLAARLLVARYPGDLCGPDDWPPLRDAVKNPATPDEVAMGSLQAITRLYGRGVVGDDDVRPVLDAVADRAQRLVRLAGGRAPGGPCRPSGRSMGSTGTWRRAGPVGRRCGRWPGTGTWSR